jgi:hypothetical protein
MNPTQREPRLFQLIRQASAAPDTGPMAEGVEWSDGTVTLRWRGQWPATSAWEGGIDAMLAVHAANGVTVFRWLPVAAPTAGPAAAGHAATGPTAAGGSAAEPTAVRGLWLSAAGIDGRCVKCGQVWPCLSCGP